eukprot:3242603-Ditylum_brightwellii.AAC.1
MSQDKGEQSKVPPDYVAIKKLEIMKGIKEKRDASKATVHRWLAALGYKYSDKENAIIQIFKFVQAIYIVSSPGFIGVIETNVKGKY